MFENRRAPLSRSQAGPSTQSNPEATVSTAAPRGTRASKRGSRRTTLQRDTFFPPPPRRESIEARARGEVEALSVPSAPAEVRGKPRRPDGAEVSSIRGENPDATGTG